MKKLRYWLAVQFFISINILTAAGLVSCNDNNDKTIWYLDNDALVSDYLAAVEDAKTNTQADIYNSLPAIISSSQLDDLRQQWIVEDGKEMILVCSLMNADEASQYPETSTSFTMDKRLPWVTLPYDLADNLIKRLPDSQDSLECRMRIIQLLGLPHDSESDRIVFFYAEASRILRPTPDPEINDHRAELDFVSANIPDHYRKWFEENSKFSYESSTPYPWTRLGYTYDWHRGTASHIGPGEFIVHPGAKAKIERKVGVWQWYKEQKTKK